MSMPKKGRRTIVVDGETYYYKIRSYSNCWGAELTVVFEDPEGKIHSHTFDRESKYIAFTPKDVEKLIRDASVD